MPAAEKLEAIATRIVREAELAAEKATAGTAQPNAFKLTNDANSMERVLAARFQLLKPELKTLATSRVNQRLALSAELRKQRLGDLHQVDLKTDRAVEDQARAMALPQELAITANELRALVPPAAVAAPAPALKHLRLRLHRVRCIDETGIDFLGSDEIKMAATTVDETGDVERIAPFIVHDDFDTGENRIFSPPRELARFNITEGSAFPKVYLVSMILAEADFGGGFPSFVNALIGRLVDRVKEEIRKAVAQLPLGDSDIARAVVAAIVNTVVNVIRRVFDFLRSLWADDVFPPRTVMISIPHPNFRFPGNATDSPETVTRFSGHGGRYDVTWDWQLVP